VCVRAAALFGVALTAVTFSSEARALMSNACALAQAGAFDGYSKSSGLFSPNSGGMTNPIKYDQYVSGFGLGETVQLQTKLFAGQNQPGTSYSFSLGNKQSGGTWSGSTNNPRLRYVVQNAGDQMAATMTVTDPGTTAGVTWTCTSIVGVGRPTISAVEPTSGSGGTSVSLTGTGFSTVTAVAFGGVNAASFTINSDTSITATAPSGSGIADITVTNLGAVSRTGLPDQFTYTGATPAPTVTSVTPKTSQASGGFVTITGTNFLDGIAIVRFGAVYSPGFVVTSATSLVAVVPGGSGTVDVAVTTAGGTSTASAADQFTFATPPTVTSVSPNGGAGGTVTTIAGTGLSGAQQVLFGGSAATSFTVNSDTAMTATAPPGAGTVDVTVRTPNGFTATSPADQFTYAVATNTLTASVTGNGTVTSDDGAISCPSTCSTTYGTGMQVTLRARPSAGSSFSGWSGACSGFGSCVVTMNGAQSVSATFVQDVAILSVAVSGYGTVSSSPAGISCGSVCTMNAAGGTVVTLTATPSGGATFSGWGGACSGNGGCAVTLNATTNVTAVFSAPGGGSPTSRTWVSAALGNDANPCNRDAPCLTFAAALAQTTAGGEIDVLDPGDFGPLTITGSITVAGDTAGVSGTMIASGAGGIVINAGSTDVVTLQGLSFNGLNASLGGIVINSAARVNIEDCAIREFAGPGQAGLFISPSSGRLSVLVTDTAITANNAGVIVKPASGATAGVAITRTAIDQNLGDGLRVDGSGGGASTVSLSDGSVSLNAGNGIAAISGPGSAVVSLIRVVAAADGLSGIDADQSHGGTASVTVGDSMLFGNAVAAQTVGGASLLSAANNHVLGNGTNGPLPGIVGLQ
jgi:IPT/TIG domain/Divergent InlB B-repeat domain